MGFVRPKHPDSGGPPSHSHAATLLKAAGKTVWQVVRVDPDSILYLGASGCPMTAWLWRDGMKLEMWVEPGFAAEPHALCPLPIKQTLESAGIV